MLKKTTLLSNIFLTYKVWLNKMVEKHIMIDLDDEKAGKVAEVLSSGACKKILSVLAEKNMSESDLAKELKIPLNTLEYNLKKLIEVGLVEKAKDFFWSSKGKKIPVYKAVRKSIVITPNTKKLSGTLRSVVGAGVVSLIVGIGLKVFYNPVVRSTSDNSGVTDIFAYGAEKAGATAVAMAPSAADFAEGVAEGSAGIPSYAPTILSAQSIPLWLWFIVGAAFALLIFIILNWRKM